jgi:hypothetical protein
LVVFAGLILVLIYVPKIQVSTGYWLHPKVIFDMENEARRTLAYIIGGLLVFIGIILTFWQIRILGKQVLVSQEGQITERFTRAIEQLGSEKVAIRFGGIYALERIAKDSDKDYWTILETLTAVVRAAPLREPPAASLYMDVQAILTVLARRKYHFGQGENQPLDLRGTDLRGADLSGAHLEGAILRETHLEGADLGGAHLERADLTQARMEKAFLREAHLDGANLMQAHLEGADLRGASLEGAILWVASLEGADLTGAIGLNWEQLVRAIVDDNTKLPTNLREKPKGEKEPKEGDAD